MAELRVKSHLETLTSQSHKAAREGPVKKFEPNRTKNRNMGHRFGNQF